MDTLLAPGSCGGCEADGPVLGVWSTACPGHPVILTVQTRKCKLYDMGELHMVDEVVLLGTLTTEPAKWQKAWPQASWQLHGTRAWPRCCSKGRRCTAAAAPL
ncbi:unnamed protein product [Durusdinium trenchii]|uniref:Uncharacterized protein n=1 Tax=Durusdinium trenchii TaxID=1381693 RepID=A0ABP0SGT7_9DINO|eukprot:g18492.t1